MRIRTFTAAALLAVAVLAPSTANAATVCYDVDVVVNGDQVVKEAGCLPE